MIAVQASDSLAVNVSAKLVDWPAADYTVTAGKESQRNVVVGALTYQGRLYVPAANALCGKVISLFHDNPESGHFGALKTTELVSRDFNWPAMDSHVRKYVSGCEVCHQIKHLSTPGTGSTCPWRHHHGHGKASRWTLSLTCQSQCHRATPGFSLYWNDWERWQSTYSARQISTRWSWPGSHLNTSFASLAFRTTELQIATPSSQADSVPGYALTWVLTIGSWQPSIHRQMGRQSVKSRRWSSISGFLQLWAGQLGWTFTTSRIRLQPHNTRVHEDDSILGRLPLLSGDAV